VFGHHALVTERSPAFWLADADAAMGLDAVADTPQVSARNQDGHAETVLAEVRDLADA
jgi:hypothetical protein